MTDNAAQLEAAASRFLWYLTAPDGRYPWEPEGRWITSFQHMQQLASTIDNLGFYGALLGTGGNDVLTVATSMIGVTRNMRFLTAIYPGLVSPVQLAQQALTFDHFSGGRLMINAVNGNDAVLPGYGLHVPHDERYVMSAEYWEVFRRAYSGDHSAFEGRYYQTAPRQHRPAMAPPGPTQHPTPPIWGAGASAAGVEHAIGLVERYLHFADTPARIGAKIAEVDALARARGRKLTFGTRLWLVVRDTEDAAWDQAEWLLRHSRPDTLAASADGSLRMRGVRDGLTEAHSDDPRVARVINALRGGRLPAVRDLEYYPNMWSGPNLFGFDVFGGGPNTYLVGSPGQVAARIRELESAGLSAFIVSGWPLIEEAHRFAEQVLPLLAPGYEALSTGTSSHQELVQA